MWLESETRLETRKFNFSDKILVVGFALLLMGGAVWATEPQAFPAEATTFAFRV